MYSLCENKISGNYQKSTLIFCFHSFSVQDSQKRPLEYHPLILEKIKDVPEDSEIPGVALKMHVGDPRAQIAVEDAFADLPPGCLIQKQKKKGVKVAV